MISSALAHGFLAASTEADWARAPLIAAGSAVLGARRRWLPALVDDVLRAFPRPPLRGLRELREWIASAPGPIAAVEAAAERGRPLRLARHPVYHEPGAAPGGVPANPAELAALCSITPGQLEWFADTRLWNRRLSGDQHRLEHYRYRWLERPGRAPRLLEIPGERLRAVQRSVLDCVLAELPVHPAAHGFVPGRDARSGAAVHTGRDVVIGLDLRTFFARVGYPQILRVLRGAGHTEAVATLIAGLSTHAVPPRILREMPPGGSPEERFALRRAFAARHLPQGAPTSPALANLVGAGLDRRLAGWAQKFGATYTRYADDLTFSGDRALRSRATRFIRGVDLIIAEEGHALNPRKTRVQPAAISQRVTGIVVNRHPNLPRREYDLLRAILHNCALHGPASQNRAGHPDFRAHLRGRIGWAAALNPDREAALTAAFNRIDWDR